MAAISFQIFSIFSILKTFFSALSPLPRKALTTFEILKTKMHVKKKKKKSRRYFYAF